MHIEYYLPEFQKIITSPTHGVGRLKFLSKSVREVFNHPNAFVSGSLISKGQVLYLLAIVGLGERNLNLVVDHATFLHSIVQFDKPHS